MSEPEAKTVCILGRQPALGLAELESIYGHEHVMPINGAALLDIPAEDINFNRFGGTVKVARILHSFNHANWGDIAKYLLDKIPEHLTHLPAGKFTLGLSVYGLPVDSGDIGRTALQIKSLIKKTGRPVRVVPNNDAALSSAQVLHNKLTHKGAWELILIKNGSGSLLAQTLFVQDIEAYAARDQARPARDTRIGMLPPKLAQIIVNLAAGNPNPTDSKAWNRGDGAVSFVVLDPFCGTGVILQEALLMGYSAYGTDIEPRMIEATKKNLRWLVEKHPTIEGRVTLEIADATNYKWPGFSMLASETYLGRPLNSLPADDKLKDIITDTNTIIKKFLGNLASQLKPGRNICLAVPAWRKPNGSVIELPLLDKLTDIGYNYLDLKHMARSELIYFRENQVVARRLLRLEKV